MARVRSLWLEEALAAEDVQEETLRSKDRADVCIVGGGYTGLWTAIRIKELEPSADVVVIDADICGGGPSGRNGGFALSWWSKIDTLIIRPIGWITSGTLQMIRRYWMKPERSATWS